MIFQNQWLMIRWIIDVILQLSGTIYVCHDSLFMFKNLIQKNSKSG